MNWIVLIYFLNSLAFLAVLTMIKIIISVYNKSLFWDMSDPTFILWWTRSCSHIGNYMIFFFNSQAEFCGQRMPHLAVVKRYSITEATGTLFHGQGQPWLFLVKGSWRKRWLHYYITTPHHRRHDWRLRFNALLK